MTVAYLTNQYPHVSHSFIRREIAGLEALGMRVERFSIRSSSADLVDPADLAERAKTRVILDAGWFGLLVATIRALVAGPLGWLRAFGVSWKMERRSDRGVLRHLVYLAEACWLARELRGVNAIHLHAHFGTNPAAVALLSHILGGPKFSFTVHGPEEFDKPESLSLGLKINHAQAIIAVSHFGRSQLLRWSNPADWVKIHVVRCGVDAAFLKSEPTAVPDVPRLVCIGRLSEQKGQLLLLEALRLIRKNGVQMQLVLAGDGPMRPAVEAYIQNHGLDDCVRITGWISNDEVRNELLAARALVLPSFAEGLPVVIMEALALGRPVISTYVAGIPELVRDGDSGWLVPAGSVHDLCTAIATALATPAESLNVMGRAGAARVAELHDAQANAKELAEIIGAPKNRPNQMSPTGHLSH